MSELIGTPVDDAAGHSMGRVCELALSLEHSTTRVSSVMLKGGSGQRSLAPAGLSGWGESRLKLNSGPIEPNNTAPEHALLLGRDLLDQQIIDVHGRKVVRVNDVNLHWIAAAECPAELRAAEVEIGVQGAIRRLLKGVLPMRTVDSLALRIKPRIIPWEFVNLIETDPARRVHLRVDAERLQTLHPSDIADILEELSPAERQAVFTMLDEHVAAEALEEVNPKMQRSLIETLDSERAADIVEEMDPGAAADLLAELPQSRTKEILHQMEPAERQEVEQLLDFREDSAAGRMTTDYFFLPEAALVSEVNDAIRGWGERSDEIDTVYLLSAEKRLTGVVPLSRVLLAKPESKLSALADQHFICCSVHTHELQVAELFDKYNLKSLPVVDDKQQLGGVIFAHQIISILQHRKK